MAVYTIKGRKLQTACATPARTGDVDRVMQGGLPPVPYRQASARWINGARSAREPFASRGVKMEIIGDRTEWVLSR